MSKEQKKQEVNLDEIPLEELRRLAEAEAAGQKSEAVEETPSNTSPVLKAILQGDQPRDDQGRFKKTDDQKADEDVDRQLAAAEDVEEKHEDDEEEPETVYRRVIDLGDGAGVQVFEATTVEELVEKLVEAQKNATKKIRELVIKKKEEEQVTADEEFVTAQKLMSRPTAEVKRIFESIVGMPIETFKTKVERLEAFEKAQADNAASTSFVQKHPEYVANEANGKRMVKYLEAHNLPVTEENLTKAFQDLNEIGLVELKSKDVNAAKERTGAGDEPRIEEKSEEVVPQQRRRVSSGLSQRGRVQAPPAKPKEPSEEELYAMPMEQLLELANSQGSR